MSELNFHTHNLSSQNPTSLVIFLHGYGANGQDLLNLTPYFNEIIKDAAFIAPDAPNINPYHPNSYYWFPLEKFTTEYLEEKVLNSTLILEKFIKARQAEYNITNKDTYLVGFSQGSMLALHTGLKQEQEFKFIISFSGGCLSKPQENFVFNKTPVILTHGKLDDVLDWEYSQNSAEFLKSKNINIHLKYLVSDNHYISKEALLFVKNTIADS